MILSEGEKIGVVCVVFTTTTVNWNAKTYFDSMFISVLFNILAKYPWSANFIIPVLVQALINSHQHCMDESHFLSSQQTCESWCGKPC